MSSANLGTKRVCPKCDAKFYDFGAADPIKCPKCAHSWKDSAAKKKADAKPKKEVKAKPLPIRKPIIEDEAVDPNVELPEVEEGDEAMDIEPIEDEGVELTSLEEVEEHEEEDDEKDPNSDDATDEMFTEIPGDGKLVDDLEDHLDEEDDEEDSEEEDDGEDDDTPKKPRRK